VAYDRLKIWADKKNVLPTKIECLTEANMPIKTLYFKEVKDFGGGIKRPSVVEADSPLYKGYKSIMIFAGGEEAGFQGRGLHPDLHAEPGVAAEMTCRSFPIKRGKGRAQGDGIRPLPVLRLIASSAPSWPASPWLIFNSC
jgi:hypothetical protein